MDGYVLVVLDKPQTVFVNNEKRTEVIRFEKGCFWFSIETIRCLLRAMLLADAESQEIVIEWKNRCV